MEQNNVHKGPMDADGDFDGHPSQAHADHAAIMKAHGIIGDPARMEAVHALHQSGGGLMNYLKKKQKDFSMKAPQEAAANNPDKAHGEAPAEDHDSDMAPNPVMQVGSKKSSQMG